MNFRKPFQIKARHRKGCCFRLAWFGLMKSTERLVLVHGEVNGPDSTRIPHAWLVGDDFIYDVVLDKFFTLAEYINGFAAVPPALAIPPMLSIAHMGCMVEPAAI